MTYFLNHPYRRSLDEKKHLVSEYSSNFDILRL